MANSLSQIKHVVTLMLENRSFDNILGALYPPGTPNFEGVANTKNANLWNGTQYWPQHGTDMIQPYPDPNEEYQYVYRQMFNDFTSPWPPAKPPGTPPMSGFVSDYATAPDKPPDPRNIMNYFEPDDVPVISGLAKGYAVCDHWFCSIPSQTLGNRSYVHAGTSSGYVNNQWKPLGLFLNSTTTIYNLLELFRLTWRVYSGGGWLMSNALLTQKKLWPLTAHFWDLKQFYKDIQSAATFPSYVFIEPNYMWSEGNPENDEHPEAGLTADPKHPSNVLFGEQLLFEIFTALTRSPAWESTLLIVTFDEHGGTFDHVAPPSAVSPDGIVIPRSKPGGSDFAFDRLGVRVPGVLVSPLIDAGTISNTVYDHTSVIKTVINAFDVAQALLNREANSTDFSSVLNRATPRTDIPKITPRKTPPVTSELVASFADVPLNDLQRAMLLLAIRFAVENAPTVAAAMVESPQTLRTHADGWRVLAKLSAIEPSLRGLPM
jgi:phospholipase C